MEVLKNVSLTLFSAGKKVYLKTKKTARAQKKNIAFCNTSSSGFAKPQDHADGKMTS